jgi:hypothetical protein
MKNLVANPTIAASVLLASDAAAQSSFAQPISWPIWPAVATVVAAICAAGAALWVARQSAANQRQLIKLQGDMQADQQIQLAELQGGIQTSVQKELQTFQYELERRRANDLFLHERATHHLGQISDAAEELHAIAGLVGQRYWLSRGDLVQTEKAFRTANAKFNLHIQTLKSMGLVSERLADTWRRQFNGFIADWVELVGLVALRDPEFRKEFPGAGQFPEQIYFERWQALQTRTANLLTYVAEVAAEITRSGAGASGRSGA